MGTLALQSGGGVSCLPWSGGQGAPRGLKAHQEQGPYRTSTS
jgi:hypothetical protein